MARRNDIQYVRYYTTGAAAPQVDHQQKQATLPKYKAPKRIPIPFDPVAVYGSVVAVVLAVLMIAGIWQVSQTNRQVRQMQAQVISLERTNELLQEQYESSYDLNEIRAAAESMGMIPREEAMRLSVPVPAVEAEAEELSWWESLLTSLRQFFA